MTTGNTIIDRVQPKFKDQKHQVLWHFEQHGSLTSGDADRLYGIARLASRIFDLREMGHIIETEKQPFKTRLDKSGQFGKYIYKGFNENYVKPPKVDNSALMKMVKDYALSFAVQMNKTYNSRFLKGQVKESTRDNMLRRHWELTNFIAGLK